MDLKRLQSAVSEKDTRALASVIEEIRSIPSPKNRKETLEEANRIIGEEAILSRRSDLLGYITDPSDSLLSSLISEIAMVFCQTGSISWWQEILDLTRLFARKGHQSETLAAVALLLVQYGVEHHERSLIQHAQEALHRITIRKYRSDILYEIIPLIIRYGREEQDPELLHTALFWLDELTDTSRKARIQDELAMELTALWEVKGSDSALTDAIQIAMDIRQKTIRKTVISRIMDRVHRSGRSGSIGPAYFRWILSLFDESLHDDFLNAVLTSSLSHLSSRKEVYEYLSQIQNGIPEARANIVTALLRVAEKRHDAWYLDLAREWNRRLPEKSQVPVEDIVNSALLIARNKPEGAFLRKFLPDLLSMNPVESSSLLMKAANAFIAAGEISPAVELATHIRAGIPRVTRAYFNLLVSLITEATIHGKLEEVSLILAGLEWFITDAIVRQSVVDYCKKRPVSEVFRQIPAIADLADHHSEPGRIRLESIKILVDRGFLQAFEPDLLVDTALGISSVELRDLALAAVASALTEVPPSHTGRGALSEALGIVSRIHSHKIRAEVMVGVVDQASHLALERREPAIIDRMVTAVDELLDPEYRGCALSRIANGYIAYGIEHRDLPALESAGSIYERLKGELKEEVILEPLIEGYIRAGSRILKDPVARGDSGSIDEVLVPFRRALELIGAAVPEAELNISLSGYVDIMLEYAGTTPVAEFSLPILLFITGMTGEREQEAMLQRVAYRFISVGSAVDAGDAYRAMVQYLQDMLDHPGSFICRTIQSRLIPKIHDPYDRFVAGLRLLSFCIDADDLSMARTVCELIRKEAGEMDRAEDRCLALCETARLAALFEPGIARSLVEEARSVSDAIPEISRSAVLRSVVIATSEVYRCTSAGEDLGDALRYLDEVRAPDEYIRAATAIFRVVRDPALRQELAASINEAVHAIDDAYLIITLLGPLSEVIHHASTPSSAGIRSSLEDAIEAIPIPSLALYARSTIESGAGRDGLMSLPPGAPGEDMVRKIGEEILSGCFQLQDLPRLERAFHSISKKADRTIAYSVLFQNAISAGLESLASPLLEAAKNEARGVRPRSRRVEVLVDLACRVALAGKVEESSEIFESALSEAHHISDPGEREGLISEIEDIVSLIDKLLA
ncbi:MAG: hypothetical protein ACXQTG_00115 [Methanoculleaceae archaeon]